MNVIPLIDVMLVLLAIVLITASFIVKDNLNLDLPETNNTQSFVLPDDQTLIKLHLDANNQFYWDEKATSLTHIKQQLSRLNKEQAITIEVDKNAKFGAFVSLIDELKGQSLTNLTILTKSQSK